MASPDHTPTLLSRIDLFLARTQNVSALSYSSFLFIHLTSPFLASLSPDLASSTMILTRVYYQNEWIEPVIIWGSLTTHLASGIGRRIIRTVRRRRAKWRRQQLIGDVEKRAMAEENGEVSTTSPSTSCTERKESLFSHLLSLVPPFSLHHLTGYLLIPFHIHHTLVHRILPSSSDPPYLSLSPSLLSFSYPSYAIANYPVTALATYGTLVTLAGYHGIAGMRTIFTKHSADLKPRRPDTDEKGPSDKDTNEKSGIFNLRTLYIGLLTGVGIGIMRLGIEGKVDPPPKWLSGRFNVVLREGGFRI